MSEPVPTLEYLPRHGVTHINVWCNRCHHEAKVSVKDIDLRQTIIDLAAKLRCSKCGEKDCGAMPSWPNRPGEYSHGETNGNG